MTTHTISPAHSTLSSFRPALLLGLICFIASLFCLTLRVLDNAISPIWYASALMTAVVFRSRGRQQALLLLACLAGTLGAHIMVLGPHWPLFSFAFINLLQSLLGGYLLRLLIKPESALDSLMSWLKIVVTAGMLVPLASGLVALWWSHFSGGTPTLRFFTVWVLSEVIGMLALGPICLLWQPRYLRLQVQQDVLLATLIALAASLLMSFLALRFLPWPFTFVMVILFWVAVRLPRLAAFLVFFANVSLISLMLVLGLVSMPAFNSSFMITAPWLPLLLILIPSHMMTMVMHAFREEKKHIRASEETNRRLMERITLANEAGGIGVWEWDVMRNEMSWDRRMYTIYELEPTLRPTYAFWLSRLLPEDRPLAQEAVRRALEDDIPFSMECRITTRNGLRFIRTQAESQRNAEGKIARLLGINQDITELRLLTEALYREKEQMLITLDAIGEAVISTDEEMRVTFMNPVAEQMSGWTQEQAAGKSLGDILRITHGARGPEVEDILCCNLPGTMNDPDRDLVLHNASGEHFAIQYSLTPLKTVTGKNIGSVMVMQDVSESREMLKRLHYSASHDTLTRLPNRASFDHQLKRLLLSASERQQQHVLVFIDLDRFKAVNDSAGHAAGDALLTELAELMTHRLRSNDFLARLGGDEFGLLIADCGISAARQVAQDIVNAINDYRFLWESKLYRIGASAGLTLINGDNCQSSEVLAQADLACYNAKHNGRGQLTVYETRPQPATPVTLTFKEQATPPDKPLRWQAWSVSAPGKTQTASFHLLQPRLTNAQGHEAAIADYRAALPNDTRRLALDHALIESFFSLYAPGIARKGLQIVLPLTVEGLMNVAWQKTLFSHLDASPLHGDALIMSLETCALLQHSEALRPVLQHLRQQGCRILLRDFGRNLDLFKQIAHEQIDFIQLSPDLTANVHFNLMDEMLVSIIHGQAQRLNIATVAGPVDLAMALSTLNSIGINGVWGDALSSCVPLNTLLENSFFAIK
ncbi:diguanylate cyclase domain-containing protein [Pantoea sp. FN0307]|uniref:diguanylate cyclase domain-containing protein n=1 Tax=Pantoea sp. FN0307 TaxID=3418560 RepID=UPI003CF0881E